MSTRVAPEQGDIFLEEPDGLRPITIEPDSGWMNEDLGWIMQKFAARLLADGASLNVHREEASELVIYAARNSAWQPSIESILTIAREAARSPLFFSQSKKSRLSWMSPPQPTGVGRALMVEAAETSGIRLTVCAVYRRSNIVQEFAAEQMARKLLPVIGGYFRLWLFSRHQERKLTAFRAAMNLSDVGIIIIDSYGAVVGENATATAIFERNDVLKKSPRSLAGVTRGDTAKLHAAIDQASIENGPSALISLRRIGGGRPIIAVVSPIAKRPEISSDPSVILCVYDSDKDLTSVLTLCCKAYNLTHTETTLVGHLVNGRTMIESATLMRIAEATARSYLKQIFAKTETNRQTDLVRVMLLSIARTSCSDFCTT